MTENDLTYKIRGAAFKVYNALGPGLLEKTYEEAMIYELTKEGLKVESQVEVPVIYDGQKLQTDLRLDLLVEDTIIVELKSVNEFTDLHHKQLMTYLRLMRKHIGLLINFNTASLDEKSIHRLINGYIKED